jgi:hypothetical protein
MAHNAHTTRLTVDGVDVGLVREWQATGLRGDSRPPDSIDVRLEPGTVQVDLARRPNSPDFVKEFAGGDLRVLLNGVPVDPHHARVRVDGDALLLHLNASTEEIGRWHRRLAFDSPTRRSASGDDARLRVNGEDVPVDSVEVRTAGPRLLVDANAPGAAVPHRNVDESLRYLERVNEGGAALTHAQLRRLADVMATASSREKSERYTIGGETNLLFRPGDRRVDPETGSLWFLIEHADKALTGTYLSDPVPSVKTSLRLVVALFQVLGLSGGLKVCVRRDDGRCHFAGSDRVVDLYRLWRKDNRAFSLQMIDVLDEEFGSPEWRQTPYDPDPRLDRDDD